MSQWRAAAEARIAEAASADLLRTVTQLSTPQQVQAVINGQRVINFSSNDYLGWANDPQHVAWMTEGAQRYGVGSGASHWVVGHTGAHARLEQAIADWLGVDAVALFATGYLANLASVATLGAQASVHQDRLNHASLLQAGQLAQSSRRFAHGDPQALEARLIKTQGLALVVTDGVFSMDGDVAPVGPLSELCRKYDALLMVDDAHGFGVLGPQGRGTTAGHAVPLVMGTLGKAIGAGGAFVAGDSTYVEWIRQFAKPYTYTTALSPALAYVAARAIERLQAEPEHQARLAQRIEWFKSLCHAAGITPLPSDSAVQAIVIGDNQAALSVSEGLKRQGLWVSAIRPPTVPAGTARLRVALSAAHTPADIEALVAGLAQCLG